MKELTKPFRIVYNDENQILLPIEYGDNTPTYVGEGRHSAEFDTSVEAEIFIRDNNLIFIDSL